MQDMLSRQLLSPFPVAWGAASGLMAYLTTPALATEANGTNFDKTSFVVGETLSRGTSLVSETARSTEVRVAAVYADHQLDLPLDLPVPISVGVISIDLFALLKFTCSSAIYSMR